MALVLVDGQKLLDYAGEEEKYLKSLLWGLRDGLEKLKDDILTDGEPLTEFPASGFSRCRRQTCTRV